MDEEIKTQRNQWQKPELIVLARGKPEEAILTLCKADVGHPATASIGSHDSCTGALGGCIQCEATAST
jgi:hypothetical protein